MKKNEFLKKIRIDNGLSRSKIAKILEVAPVTIEKYENDKLPIKSNLKYIQGICALYGYNPEIFDYDEITPGLLKKLELTQKQLQLLKYKQEKTKLKEQIKELLKTATLSQMKEIIIILKQPPKIEMGDFLENRFMKVY